VSALKIGESGGSDGGLLVPANFATSVFTVPANGRHPRFKSRMHLQSVIVCTPGRSRGRSRRDYGSLIIHDGERRSYEAGCITHGTNFAHAVPCPALIATTHRKGAWGSRWQALRSNAKSHIPDEANAWAC